MQCWHKYRVWYNVVRTGMSSCYKIAWHELTHLVLLRDGGFGRVERAYYRGLEVVIKRPLSWDPYVLQTFVAEAQVLNLLSHPNIVKLIGVCTDKKALIWIGYEAESCTFLKSPAETWILSVPSFCFLSRTLGNLQFPFTRSAWFNAPRPTCQPCSPVFSQRRVEIQ